jgi:hypothetical protein
MSIGYMIYEAERTKTVAEQRAADIRAGEFAASVARLGRLVKGAIVRAAGTRRTGVRGPEFATAIANGTKDVSLADLERLYSAPSIPAARGSNCPGGECTVRSA